MYQFSLDWFQDMFTAAISGSMSIKGQQRRRSSVGGVLVGTPRRSSIQHSGRQMSGEFDGSARRPSVEKRLGEI